MQLYSVAALALHQEIDGPCPWIYHARSEFLRVPFCLGTEIMRKDDQQSPHHLAERVPNLPRKRWETPHVIVESLNSTDGAAIVTNPDTICPTQCRVPS